MWQQIIAQVSSDEIKVPKTDFTAHSLATILRIVFGVAGGVALIVIVLAGLQFILSVGNPQAAGKAKNALIYALVGLVICAIAFGLVSFVLLKI